MNLQQQLRFERMKPADFPYRGTLFLDDGREIEVFVQCITPFMNRFPRSVIRVEWINQNRNTPLPPMYRQPDGSWSPHAPKNTL